jgi:hypothetical protein
MADAKTEEKSDQKSPEKFTLAKISIGTHNDRVNPICTLSFKDSTDRGFQFKTSNIDFTIRMIEKDYYNVVDTLISEIIDELQEVDDLPNYSIEDLQDYLCAKLNGDL